MTAKDIFLRALAGQQTPRPATGTVTSIVTTDLMDETGIHLPEAHLEAEKLAGLAAGGHTILGFDNVMPLFSVWHESAAMGCSVDWGERHLMPSCMESIYRIDETIRIPPDLLTRPSCRVALDALRLLDRQYGNDVAVVGKVFGPWTLGYHMFGVQEFLIHTILDPDAVRRAIETLKEVTVQFANAQIEAGAVALCLGDHATRDLCSPQAYRDFLLDVHQELAERIACPLVLHICGDTEDRIPMIAQSGVACFHFDSKVPAEKARALAGPGLTLMGGTSNFEIIRQGSAQAIKSDVQDKLRAGIDVLGPECAVPLDAPSANLRMLADEVKRQSRGDPPE